MTSVNVADAIHAARHGAGGADSLSGYFAQRLVRTPVKSTAYAVQPGDLVPVDCSTTSVPLSLPNAPLDGTRCAIQVDAISGSHSCTVTCGGTDVFDLITGATTVTLDTYKRSIVVEYDHTDKIWSTVSSSANGLATPAAALDNKPLAWDNTAQTLKDATALLNGAYDAGRTVVIHADAGIGNDANAGTIPSKPKATIAAALSALPSGIGTVILWGAFVDPADIVLDISQANIVAGPEGAQIYRNGLPTTAAVKIVSTANFTNQWKNAREVLSGVSLLGPGSTGVGLLIGDSVDTNQADFVVGPGAMFGWAAGIQIGSNAFRVRFRDRVVYSCVKSVSCPTGLSNYGEGMVFNRCTLVSPVDLHGGEWHFDGCCFDTAPVTQNNGSACYYTDCHFENPATSSVYRYIDVAGSTDLAVLSSCQVVINQPQGGGNYTESIFHVADANASFGLVLESCSLPAPAYFTPETGDGARYLVAGLGRVKYNNLSIPTGNAYGIAQNIDPYCLSGTAQLTSGNVAVSSTSFAAVTGLADVTVKANPGETVLVGLSARAEPGAGQYWLDMTAATVVSGSPVSYLQGAAVGVAAWEVSGDATDYNHYSMVGGMIPYVVQAADVVNGSVTIRLLAKVGSNSRTLTAVTTLPLQFSVVKLK